jgi:ribosomal protein L4
MAALLNAIAPEAKNKKVLIVIGGKQENVTRAARNIPGVTYEQARQLHAYEVMNHTAVIFMKQAIAEVEKTFAAKKEEK